MRRLLVLLSLLCTLSKADELVIVANSNFPLPQLDEHQIKQIYLKRTRYLNGIELLPINLSVRDPLRKAFELSVLQMSKRALKQHWTKAHYRGTRPPMVKHSVLSTIAFVRQIDGSIAYLPRSAVPSDLIELYVQSEKP